MSRGRQLDARLPPSGFVPIAAQAQQPTLFGHGFDGPMEGHPPIMQRR